MICGCLKKGLYPKIKLIINDWNLEVHVQTKPCNSALQDWPQNDYSRSALLWLCPIRYPNNQCLPTSLPDQSLASSNRISRSLAGSAPAWYSVINAQWPSKPYLILWCEPMFLHRAGIGFQEDMQNNLRTGRGLLSYSCQETAAGV